MRTGLAALAVPLLVGSALAADSSLPPEDEVGNRVIRNWTGLYAGSHAGFGWAELEQEDPLSDRYDGTADVAGPVVGGQFGYNWQIWRFVVGVEGDLALADIAESGPRLSDALDADTIEINGLGTIRGRLGFTSGRVFFYGTGGGAAASVEVGDSLETTEVENKLLKGWTAGGGMEVRALPNVSLKTEYLILKLDPEPFSTDGNRLEQEERKIGAEAHVFRAGVNYLFDW